MSTRLSAIAVLPMKTSGTCAVRVRPRYPMPKYIKSALEERGLVKSYKERPPYQQNDYIGWIDGAVRADTKEKRLQQMLYELEKGGIYMKMTHPSSRKSE